MSFRADCFGFVTGQRRERPEITEVRRTLLDKLLAAFALLGFPAAGIGAAQAYIQGRWVFSLIYLFVYVLFVLVAFARKVPFSLRGFFLVSALFLLALSVLIRIGMSGVGLPLMIGFCMLASLLFGFRGGVLSTLIGLGGIGVVATAITAGYIELHPGQMLTSHSPLAWITALCVFLMVVSVTVTGFQMFSGRIEDSLDLLEENKRQLEVKNRALSEEVQERKRVQEALKESEERFRSLIRNSSDLITVLTAKGMTAFQSPAIRRMLGYTPEELIGVNGFDYIHPEDLPAAQRALSSVIQQGCLVACRVSVPPCRRFLGVP